MKSQSEVRPGLWRSHTSTSIFRRPDSTMLNVYIGPSPTQGGDLERIMRADIAMTEDGTIFRHRYADDKELPRGFGAGVVATVKAILTKP